MVDAAGRTAHWTGAKALGNGGIAVGKDSCFRRQSAEASRTCRARWSRASSATARRRCPDRLIGALEAGLQSGGEAGPVHSANVIVVHEQFWPLVDLRVDWADDNPIGGAPQDCGKTIARK